MDYAQDGNLTGYEPEDIADASMWGGDAKEFVNALITAGFIDDADGLHVHDWEENAGRLIEQRKRNKERMKRVRAEDVQRTCIARATHNNNTIAHVQGLDKIREDKIRGEERRIYITHVRGNRGTEDEARVDGEDPPSPPPPDPTQEDNPVHYPAGWEPTPETRDAVNDLLHRLESLFGVWPISPKQMGNGEGAVMEEELAAVLRLLSVDEVVEVVKSRMEAREAETKGVDRPRNLKWYMPAIKEAFYERDRRLEEEERRREEEKRAQARASPQEPVPFGDVIQEIAQGAEITEEERERIKERIRKAKQKIAVTAEP